jgi:hypothetical protein
MRRRSASNKGILTQEEFAAQFSHPAAQANGPWRRFGPCPAAPRRSGPRDGPGNAPGPSSCVSVSRLAATACLTREVTSGATRARGPETRGPRRCQAWSRCPSARRRSARSALRSWSGSNGPGGRWFRPDRPRRGLGGLPDRVVPVGEVLDVGEEGQDLLDGPLDDHGVLERCHGCLQVQLSSSRRAAVGSCAGRMRSSDLVNGASSIPIRMRWALIGRGGSQSRR